MLASDSHQNELEALVDMFSAVQLAVLGDPMIDAYHHGRIDRLSQEAPVPVFVEDQWEARPGGAHNVVHNLEKLGCTVTQVYPEPAQGLAWTMKHRYLVGTHQVFRIDEDHEHGDFRADFDRLQDVYHGLVISDYGRGVCSEANCEAAIRWARRRQIPIVVDPKGSCWRKYDGATVLCPNHLEFNERYRTTNDDSAIVLKRAAAGIDLLEAYSDTRRNFPARARRVYDVTGAGDTVTAVLAATLAAGGTLEQGCELANLAAGLAVGEVGTVAITRGQLIREIYA